MSEIIRILGRECVEIITPLGAIEIVPCDEGELSDEQWKEYCKRVRAQGPIDDDEYYRT